MSMREDFLRMLRVPPAPSAPAGDEDVRLFQAAPELMIYKFAEWAAKNGAAAIGLWFGLRFAGMFSDVIPATVDIWWFVVPGGLIQFMIDFVESLAVVSFITQALFGLVLIRLDFENRWYMVSNRSLRIREGLLHMREITVTFANVQHVGIRQGPLQRLIGIADVEVRTAGGSGSEQQKDKGAGTHVAYFEGIKDASMVSDVIRERLRLHRDAGLGDPDDIVPPALQMPQDNSLLFAARTLADEARLLRQALSPASSHSLP